MAVDSVRRLSQGGEIEPLPLDSISNFGSDRRESFETDDLLRDHNDHFESYDYADQTRYYREFEFTTDPMFGAPKSATGVLEYRTGSGLVFLTLDQDSPKPDTIFDELHSNTDDVFPIEIDFSPTYESISEFSRAADKIIKVQSTVGIESPMERINNGDNIPIEMVRLRFSFDSESCTVTYSDGQINIPLPTEDQSLFDSVTETRSIREYVIQVFEMAFSES